LPQVEPYANPPLPPTNSPRQNQPRHLLLKDKSLADLDVLAADIIENIVSALEGFKDLMETINREG
jgi:hypothetical protein